MTLTDIAVRPSMSTITHGHPSIAAANTSSALRSTGRRSSLQPVLSSLSLLSGEEMTAQVVQL
jgi:hypothetical protein